MRDRFARVFWVTRKTQSLRPVERYAGADLAGSVGMSALQRSLLRILSLRILRRSYVLA
jgi:hypothetical protein